MMNAVATCYGLEGPGIESRPALGPTWQILYNGYWVSGQGMATTHSHLVPRLKKEYSYIYSCTLLYIYIYIYTYIHTIVFVCIDI